MAHDVIPGNVADFNSEERQPELSNQITLRQELSFLSHSFPDASSLVAFDSMVSPSSAPPARLVSLTLCCPSSGRRKVF